VSLLDALSPALRHEIEMLVDRRVDQLLRQRRPERRFVSVREAMRLFGLSERAVRGRIARGTIVARRSGRSVLVDLLETERLLDGRS
jgi:hypothetical protein